MTGASAQSKVSFYGMIDLGLRIDDPRISGSSTTALVSGHQSGSRLGVRGSEDLGGGLSAVCALENGFSADTGQAAQGGLLFGWQVYGCLRGRSFGTVAAGRVTIFSAGRMARGRRLPDGHLRRGGSRHGQQQPDDVLR